MPFIYNLMLLIFIMLILVKAFKDYNIIKELFNIVLLKKCFICNRKKIYLVYFFLKVCL